MSPTKQPAVPPSMTFDDLRKTIDQLEGLVKSQNSDMLERLLTEVSTGLADVVQHLESGEGAASIVAAIKGLKFEAPQINVEPKIDVHPAAVSAPDVKVNVSPTPVEVTLPEMCPVVNVSVPDQPKRIVVRVTKREGYGNQISELEIIRS